MTHFETYIFNFVESIFGRDFALKSYGFWINVCVLVKYTCYLATLPVKFVKLVWYNLKEKGVV